MAPNFNFFQQCSVKLQLIKQKSNLQKEKLMINQQKTQTDINRINEQQVKRQGKKSVLLLSEQMNCIAKLASAYSKLGQQLEKQKQLSHKKQQLQLSKCIIMTTSNEANRTQNKNKAQLKQQCLKKQNTLTTVKQQFVNNVVKLNAAIKQINELKLHIQSKETEFERVKAQTKQQKTIINLLQSQIKNASLQLKNESLQKIKLKKQLTQQLLSSAHITSNIAIKSQIHKEENLSKQLQCFLRQMVDI